MCGVDRERNGCPAVSDALESFALIVSITTFWFVLARGNRFLQLIDEAIRNAQHVNQSGRSRRINFIFASQDFEQVRQKFGECQHHQCETGVELTQSVIAAVRFGLIEQ